MSNRLTAQPWHHRYWPAPAVEPASAQIIGLTKSRLSGISLSRHAYAEVLRSEYPDLRDATVTEAFQQDCKINLWAARPLTSVVLDQLEGRNFTGHNIWCLVLEATALPERTLDAATNADQIWVPSNFVYEVCRDCGLPESKLRVVPYYLPGPTRPRIPSTPRPWTVVVSWDGASNLNRKFVTGSIAAFKLAWPGSSRVRLRLKTRDLRPQDRAEVLHAISGDPRIWLDERTASVVDEIFDGAGVLLHLHRAEGYGRHIIEAMQRRVPVICTDYSGPMDWLTPTNHYGVGYELTDCRVSEYRYPQGGQWAQPNIEEAARQLRRALARFGTRTEKNMLDAAEASASHHAAFARSRRAMQIALKELPQCTDSSHY